MVWLQVKVGSVERCCQSELLLTTLKILHTTTYRFNERVSLLPHRLMLRPRESRELRLISSQITVTPDPLLTWAHDVFGNTVATATFQMKATNLVIAGAAELQLDAVAWPVLDIAFSAMSYHSVILMMIGSISVPWPPLSLRTQQGSFETGRKCLFEEPGLIRYRHLRT